MRRIALSRDEIPAFAGMATRSGGGGENGGFAPKCRNSAELAKFSVN
ncbi:MAG: hypothetical protein ACR2QC_02365 [Gammaproteobacteria bacterium]